MSCFKRKTFGYANLTNVFGLSFLSVSCVSGNNNRRPEVSALSGNNVAQWSVFAQRVLLSYATASGA